MILLLILSLLFTIVEGARVSTAKVYAERALSTAMDSVLAEYYGPLWEEYHIFGFYTGEGSEGESKGKMAAKLADYMSYTFEPNKDLNIFDNSENYELFDIALNCVTIENETMLMDYQGQLLINEAVEFMKYTEIGSGAKQLLSKLSLLETPQKVSYVYEEKQKVEEELVEIDKGILELMELLDGLQTSKKGIEVNSKGKLKTAEFFVKKICFHEVTKETVGINQENVFLALKSSYINPTKYFDTIRTNFHSLEKVLYNLEALRIDKAATETYLSEEQMKLSELNSIEKKTKKEKQQIKSIKNNIKDLIAEIKAIEDDIQKQEKVELALVATINLAKKSLSQLIAGIKPVINEAVSVLDNIILKTETAAPLLNKYEEVLNSERELIDEEIFTGLEENLKEIKRYIAVDSTGYDFAGMKAILENNLMILRQVESILSQGDYELTQGWYQNSNASFENAKVEMNQYQIDGLSLDYSTLAIDKLGQENPLDEVTNLLQTGISSMVIDPGNISDGELTPDLLPSDIAAMSQVDIDFFSKLTSFFKSAAIGESGLGMGSLFESFGSGTQILSKAGDGANKVTEHFLYQEYLKEHFMMFSAEEEDTAVSKPSALAYEQEYLLVGELTDQENLSSVISRMVFLRTVLDFVSILGDSAKLNEAKAVATALVGFTGLPILVGITQVLILLSWSLAEALCDVSALMMGKEVPILKKKIVLEFPEIFMINRSFLQSKATAVESTKELSFSYQDYLRVFLLMKSKEDLAYRSMDLMQQNI
ncbi:MAG: DUF5702 domain-containing protein, partial [Herbinix sp.]|nr:DUF5702 domain-containing protein [Herbinix sp.]